MSELDQLLRKIKAAEASGKVRKNWNPGNQGSIDIRISVDGAWYHEGRAFQRKALVKLFASILRKENGDYFLVTPAEKLSIQVDDAPFVAGIVNIIKQAESQALIFTTNLGERIVADDQHPIRVEIDRITQRPRPYIHVRDGLEALIGRNAFFELVNMASGHEIDGKKFLAVNSMGSEFILGPIDE